MALLDDVADGLWLFRRGGDADFVKPFPNVADVYPRLVGCLKYDLAGGGTNQYAFRIGDGRKMQPISFVEKGDVCRRRFIQGQGGAFIAISVGCCHGKIPVLLPIVQGHFISLDGGAYQVVGTGDVDGIDG